MRELFNRHAERMSPEEDRRIWGAVHDAVRRPAPAWKRWGIPVSAFGTLAAAAAVVIMVRVSGVEERRAPALTQVFEESVPARDGDAGGGVDEHTVGRVDEQALGPVDQTAPLSAPVAPPGDPSHLEVGTSESAEPVAKQEAFAGTQALESEAGPAANRMLRLEASGSSQAGSAADGAQAPSPASAGTSVDMRADASAGAGILRGRVTSASGEPLAFANVVVLGTSLGGMTDSLGYFQVRGVPAGSHRVKVSYLGYAPQERTVRVGSGETLAQSFRMEETDVATEESVPIESRRESSTSHRVDQEASKRHVTEALQDAVGLKAKEGKGITSEGPLHFRRGRSEGGSAAQGTIRGNAAPSSPSLAAERDARWPNSVGGTDPVNGQAFDAMFFEHYGVNPFIDTEDDRQATFAVDVDNASFTMARAYLDRGEIPPKDAIRVEEFVNALDHDYAPPLSDMIADRRGEPSEHGTFAIHLDAAPSPFGRGLTLLRVGLKGREIDVENRKPAVLTFVVDVSGSMQREDRLELVKQALGLLLDQMNDEDRVGLVVYGTDSRTLLEHTSLRDRRRIENAIARLVPEGSTNAEAGLREGYALADRGYRRGWINRVILCSDGVANVGVTDAEGILARIRAETGRGIQLTAIGFGMGNYNDVLMEKLADQGDGNYYYVDALDEARRVFVENLTGTLQTIARQTKIQVEFDPRRVERYRLLGYENRDVADRDFRNDAVDAGEVGAGHEVTALFEVKLARGARSGDLATVRIRYQDPESRKVTEEARTFAVGDIARRLEDAEPSFRMDAAAAELAEILRHSYWAKDGDLARVAGLARDAAREMRRSENVELLVNMTEQAARLRSRIEPADWRDDVRPAWEPEDEER